MNRLQLPQNQTLQIQRRYFEIKFELQRGSMTLSDLQVESIESAFFTVHKELLATCHFLRCNYQRFRTGAVTTAPAVVGNT